MKMLRTRTQGHIFHSIFQQTSDSLQRGSDYFHQVLKIFREVSGKMPGLCIRDTLLAIVDVCLQESQPSNKLTCSGCHHHVGFAVGVCAFWPCLAHVVTPQGFAIGHAGAGCGNPCCKSENRSATGASHCQSSVPSILTGVAMAHGCP